MDEQAVPTVEQLKRAALSDRLDIAVAFAASDVTIMHALHSAGQAVTLLREQVARLQPDTRNELDVRIIEASISAEQTLDRCVEAAHLVLKAIMEREARRDSARYN